jgi:hypothetical protein
VNVIVKQYHKTGILPQAKHYNGIYGDFSEVPTLMEAFEAVNRAEESFQQLPAEIRKLMDNDASQLEIWLSDEKNRKLAEEHGLLEKVDNSSDNSQSGGQDEHSSKINNGGSDASASN